MTKTSPSSLQMSDRHKEVSAFVRSVHKDLKQHSWEGHTSNSVLLKRYSSAMKELADVHWEKAFATEAKKRKRTPVSRIQETYLHVVKYFREDISKCRDYDVKWARRKDRDDLTFLPDTYESKRDGEKIKLLDVGSCYNPFSAFDEFGTTAIDIAPANDSVQQADFLTVPITNGDVKDSKEFTLQESSIDVVVCSFVFSYLPTSTQRLEMCRRAYKLLRPNGLFVILTPDGKAQHKNIQMIKSWRRSLQYLGFWLQQQTKFSQFYLLSVRKCLDGSLPRSAVLTELTKEGAFDSAVGLSEEQLSAMLFWRGDTMQREESAEEVNCD